jgi:hypothetical protein
MGQEAERKSAEMASNAPAGGPIVGRLRSVDGAGIVHLEGRFDAPVDAVWSALTDLSSLSRWLGDVEGDLRSGGEFRARFFATGWEGTCRVEACEPPMRLRVATKSEGEPDCIIEAMLTADGEQTVLAIEDRGLPIDQIAAYGAGDQVLVEDLAAHIAGHDRCDARERWRELHPAYQDLAAGLD